MEQFNSDQGILGPPAPDRIGESFEAMVSFDRGFFVEAEKAEAVLRLRQAGKVPDDETTKEQTRLE